MSKISRKLVSARKKMELNPCDVASKTGIETVLIESFEKGILYPDYQQCFLLAKALGLGYSELCDLTKKNNKFQKRAFILYSKLGIIGKKLFNLLKNLSIIVTIIALVSAAASDLIDVAIYYQDKEATKVSGPYTPSLFYLPVYEAPTNHYPNKDVELAIRNRDIYEFSTAEKHMVSGLQKALTEKKVNYSDIQFIKSSLGSIYFMLGNIDEAIKCYNDVLLLTDGDSELFGIMQYNIGQVYSHAGNVKKALAHFEKAYEPLMNSQYFIPLLCSLSSLNLLYKNSEGALLCVEEAERRAISRAC